MTEYVFFLILFLDDFHFITNYNLMVKSANKSFNQSCVDYLGPTLFNYMPFELKKKIFEGQIVNIKWLVYRYLFLELENNVRCV